MKELSIEEKAKRYDEAIKLAKDSYSYPSYPGFIRADVVFPELKERVDSERIRGAIIDIIKSQKEQQCHIDSTIYDEMIAWLEKQKVTDEEIIFRPVAGTDIRVAAKQALEKIDIGKKVVLAFNGAYIPVNGKTVGEIDSECDAWLEKQESVGEIVERCKNSWYNEGKIAGMAEGLTDDEKYQQGWHDALEKQGKQKPADKVEPKFKIGDWVVTDKNNVVQIKAIEDSKYMLENTMRFSVDYVDKCWRKWTIQDAKDGDVLCTYECGKPKIVFILKGTPKKHYALSYHCYYNIMYPHFGSDSEKGCLAPNDEDVKPATKEQRDILMKAMADAGYTFDFEKKELKKIEQKPAWSEEDETGWTNKNFCDYG